jgi:hypothetical protein
MYHICTKFPDTTLVHFFGGPAASRFLAQVYQTKLASSQAKIKCWPQRLPTFYSFAERCNSHGPEQTAEVRFCQDKVLSTKLSE